MQTQSAKLNALHLFTRPCRCAVVAVVQAQESAAIDYLNHTETSDQVTTQLGQLTLTDCADTETLPAEHRTATPPTQPTTTSTTVSVAAVAHEQQKEQENKIEEAATVCLLNSN